MRGGKHCEGESTHSCEARFSPLALPFSGHARSNLLTQTMIFLSSVSFFVWGREGGMLCMPVPWILCEFVGLCSLDLIKNKIVL